MKATFLILTFFSTQVFAEQPYRSRYKYYLDASRAESILAGLPTRNRLQDDQWLDIIGTHRKGESYKVRKGDTLWGISRQLASQPFLWRKFWQMNAYLGNPHELEVGQVIQLYQEQGDSAPIQIPVIRLTDSTYSDLDNDKFVNVTLKNQFKPRMIVVADSEVLGEITGAYTQKENVDTHDNFYITLDDPAMAKIGTRFSIVRFERSVGGGLAEKGVLGTLARLVGELKLESAGEELYKAELTAMFNSVRRGDKLIPLKAPISTSVVLNPPEDLEARIVTGEDQEKKMFGQGDLVLLNKGQADGMQMGYWFRVFQDMDPLTQKRLDVEPYFKGEVQVVAVGEIFSVGYVLRNTDVVLIGDTLVPYQSFKNPPPSPLKTIQIIEIE